MNASPPTEGNTPMPESHYDAASRITENPGWAMVRGLLAIADELALHRPVQPAATPTTVVKLTREEVKHLERLLADAHDHNEDVHVWADPLDRAFKVKIGDAVWSPPMGWTP